MASTVYFASLRGRDPGRNTVTKIRRLFEEAGFGQIVSQNALIAVKLHFGERGSDAFINPVYVRQVVDKIKEHGGKPFLTDSNTLYLGGRSNAVDHIVTAIEHGFDFPVTGAPVVIADGINGRNAAKVKIGKKRFRAVVVSGDIAAADGLVVLSHFKAHEVAGFGGAIKNLAMGCTPPAGKQQQHSARPISIEGSCVGCGKCVDICPRGAILLEGGKSRIDRALCSGCLECLTVCVQNAMDIDWETEIPSFVERMVEYAYGAVHGKAGKIGFYNFLTRISPDCDCTPWSDAPIVPDIGILASTDPVAIDAASYDLVNRQAGFADSALTRNLEPGKDKFHGLREKTNPGLQIRYGEEIGLGSSNYELVEPDW